MFKIILLITINVFILNTAKAANNLLCEKLFKTKSIDLFERVRTDPAFTRNRGLNAYFSFFNAKQWEYPIYNARSSESNGSYSLFELLKNLNSNDIYLDIGSGEGQALRELSQKKEFKAKLFGIDAIKTSADLTNSKNLQLLNGKTLEEMEQNGDLKKYFPNGVNIISDYLASDTYSVLESQALRIKLNLLKIGGHLLFTIPTSHFSFNYKNNYVATRVVPRSAHAIASTRMLQRIQDQLTINNLPQIESTILNSLNNPELPEKYVENIVLDQPDGESTTLDYQNAVIRELIEETGGILGWIDSIKGVEVVALARINSNYEQGLQIVFKRTGDIEVPELLLQNYEYTTGPALRLYYW